MLRFKSFSFLMAVALFGFIISGCQKNSENDEWEPETYVSYKIGDEPFMLNNLVGTTANSYLVDNGPYRLDPVKYKTVLGWPSSYFNQSSETFCIEMIDSLELAPGSFNSQDFEFPYGLRFYMTYHGEQGWVYPLVASSGMGSASLRITRNDDKWIEGTFSGEFYDGTPISEGRFKLYNNR